MGKASAHEAQQAAGAVLDADQSPKPPNLIGKVANWRPSSQHCLHSLQSFPCHGCLRAWRTGGEELCGGNGGILACALNVGNPNKSRPTIVLLP